MKTNHNLYVSTPNWFSSIKEEVKQTKPVIQLTVYYGSGSNSNNNGISSLSIYNKAVYKEDTLQLSDLSITGYAVIAILKEGEENNAGELTVNDVWSSSLFVPVVGGSEITINTSYDSTFTYGIAFYDILKKYISGNCTVQELIQTVIVPANAVYFRICSLSVYEEFNVKYQGLSNYSYKQLTNIYGKGLDPFTSIDNSFEYLYSSTFASDKISFVADYPLKLDIDSNNNIHFNINDLLLSGAFVTTSEEEQDISGIKIFKNGLGIGDFLLVPDKTNNSIKLIHKNELIGKESNTYFGNMYVTGWLSALGMSPGGTGPSFGGSDNLFELNDVSAVYNELGIPYAVLGTTGENTIGKVLTWDGSKWYADESLNSIKGDERYLLKKIFSKIFTAYDEKGEIIDITDYDSVIDNVSINYSLWSTGFISAYGMSKGDSNPTALYQLTDVLSENNEVQGAVIGSVLTYNGTHWYASKLDIDSSIDTNDVLNILKQYDYLTKSDADNKYLLKQVFKNIFTAYDANNNEVDICDTSVNINNIKINYGFWSDDFISALGKQLTEPSSATALYQLVDVLANETNTGVRYAKKGSVLTFDGVHWVAGVVTANGGIIDEAAIMEIIERYNYIDSKYLLDNGYLTIDSADERYLLNDLFLKIFTAYDEQGNQVDLSSDKINNIKVNYNFWSDGYLSSRGISDDIIDAIDFIEVDEKTISKRNGYLEVIGGVGNSGGVTDYNDLTNKPDLTIYALKSSLDEYAVKSSTLAGYGITNAYTKTQVDNLLGDFVTSDDVETLLDDYLPLTGGTITGDLRLRVGAEYTSPYLYFGDSDEVWMKEVTDTHLTIHADGSVIIDADLIVKGGITMYANEGDYTPSTIMDAVSVDGQTIIKRNGVLMLNPNIEIGGGGGIDSITKEMVIDALGYTPYDDDNPDEFITGITKSMVIEALGYTPYDSTNPSGYITGITKSMVTTALGFTPYNATNPNGYITSSGTANKANSLTTARTISLTGQATGSTTFDGSANKNIAVTIPTRSVRFNGTKYTVLTNSDTTSDMPNIYAADYAGTANQVCVSGGSGSAPSWVNQSAITSGACSGNAATATTATNAKKVLLTGSASNGNYRLVFSDVSAGTSENNSLYVDSANEGARYNPSTNQLTCLTYMSGASGYYIYNTDYRVYANNNEFILNTPAYFSIRMSGSTKLYMTSSGLFGIGTTSPESKLHVAGSVQADNTFWLTRKDTGNATLGYAQGGTMILRHNSSGQTILSGSGGTLYFRPNGTSSDSGQCTISSGGNLLVSGGITMYSDLRKKTILNHVELSLKEVADAPLIEHYYNSDESKRTHVGSVAQYWAELNDWFCKEDEEGFLTMEIQNAALASAISVARELTRYESKTDEQIKKLKKRIGELEEEIENLKKM